MNEILLHQILHTFSEVFNKPSDLWEWRIKCNTDVQRSRCCLHMDSSTAFWWCTCVWNDHMHLNPTSISYRVARVLSVASRALCLAFVLVLHVSPAHASLFAPFQQCAYRILCTRIMKVMGYEQMRVNQYHSICYSKILMIDTDWKGEVKRMW